jgi:UDP-GlcNAc:undecaprenyl-phosphate GlcNAc-1-phosphate transferase
MLGLIGLSFLVAWSATYVIRTFAPRIGFVDKPGARKIHHNPKPLGGGVAIYLGLAAPLLTGLVYVHFNQLSRYAAENTSSTSNGFTRVTLGESFVYTPFGTVNLLAEHWEGVKHQTPAALIFLGATLAMHVLGLVDDRKALGPYVKLFFQLGITTAMVLLMDLRALTALGPIPSFIVTVLWIAGITNAFNFLDNMDGLSAGIAAVCTTAFLIAALSIEQWFVAATLALLLGSLLGFLCFNLPPASIFMGDSGSLLIGFVLGTLTVRTTYLPPGQDFGAGWYAVFAPLVVLAVPLYDLIVVSIIRISRGKSPFVGDTNHFSHRLVARGMSRRTAVLCLYLITAATSVAAILLPHVQSTFAAMLIFGQTLLVLGVVALLEQHPLPVNAPADLRAFEVTDPNDKNKV